MKNYSMDCEILLSQVSGVNPSGIPSSSAEVDVLWQLWQANIPFCDVANSGPAPHDGRRRNQLLVEVMERLPDEPERRKVVEEARDRLVVFVDEDDNLPRGRLLGGGLQELAEIDRCVDR